MTKTYLSLTEDTLLQEEVMSVMQLIQDVNAMAEDMDKAAEFNIELLSPEARGLENGRTEGTYNDHYYIYCIWKFSE